MTWRFASDFVQGEVQSLGGMLGPVSFDLGGRLVQPFAIAPWADEEDEEHRRLPGILQRLRGEWPCVPFGIDAPRPDLPEDWRPPRGMEGAVVDSFPHGFASNHHWRLLKAGRRSVTIGIDYPEGHAIGRLVRTVTAAVDSAALDLALEIHARHDCRVPVGLHPVYKLPERPRRLHLDLAEQSRSWTFPLEVEAGRTALRPDQRDAPPNALLSREGDLIDIRTLPLPGESEDLVLLTGLGGSISFTYPDLGYSIVQTWNAAHFPACCLWISAGGRRFYPWSGRFRGLGVEPVAAPFDLGPATAAAGSDPLCRSGVPTSIALTAAEPFRTEYRIACRAA